MKLRKIISLSKYEYALYLKNYKMIILLVLSVFIYQFIISPLDKAVAQTGINYSVFEIFIALSNSGVILMILPLAFIFVVSDYPLKNSNSFLYIIRMDRINWICSEIIFALKATATFLLLTVLICCGLGFSNGKMSLCWSNITVQYNVLFPKLKGSFVDQLLPGNLYNQMSLIKCFLLSFALVFLYLFTFSMIYLLFELKKRKGIGLLIIAAIILTGTVLTGIDNGGKWLLPTAHSIIWIHYTEYYRDSVMNIGYSFLYYILVNIVIIINAFMECKCYSFEAK